MSKRKLRRRIERLQDTVAILEESIRYAHVPSSAFKRLDDYAVNGNATTAAPWCAACQGFHIPGPCRGSFSWSSRSTGGIS